MSKKLITTISMALALATSGVAIPVAGADTGRHNRVAVATWCSARSCTARIPMGWTT
jgi:hypothetical protein